MAFMAVGILWSWSSSNVVKLVSAERTHWTDKTPRGIGGFHETKYRCRVGMHNNDGGKKKTFGLAFYRWRATIVAVRRFMYVCMSKWLADAK